MSERGVIIGVLVAVAAVATVGGPLAAGPDGSSASGSPAESPLVGAPDYDAAVDIRERFLSDPGGSVDRIAAAGEHVAWTVRSPADGIDPDSDAEPVSWPTSSKVVVWDESGARSGVVDFGGRWVSDIRFVPHPANVAELAVRSCASREAASCKVELLSFVRGTEVAVDARTAGPRAEAAINGLVSGTREVRVGAKAAGECLPAIDVLDSAPGAEAVDHLPALPASTQGRPRCLGLEEVVINDHFVFATVRRENPKLSLETSIVYGLDLLAGSKRRWVAVQAPYRYSDGSTGLAVGPAFGLNGAFWEELDVESSDAGYSLNVAELPRDLRVPAEFGKTPTTSDPISPDSAHVCAIAATDQVVYELSNPRCSAVDRSGPGGAEIHRVVNPSFRPDEG